MFVDIALKKAGLTKEQVNYVILESFGDHNTALANGAVDAAMHIEPLITAGEAKGILDRWIDATEWASDFQVAVVLSSPEFIEGRSEVAQRFMVAYLKGLRDYYNAFINGEDTEEIIDIMTRHTPMKDRELWQKVNVVGLNPDGYVKTDSIAWQIDWFKDTGYYEGELTAEDLVDHSLVDFAVEYLGEFEGR
jgi:NitT/TauT family transport system substrate-binding protein